MCQSLLCHIVSLSTTYVTMICMLFSLLLFNPPFAHTLFSQGTSRRVRNESSISKEADMFLNPKYDASTMELIEDARKEREKATKDKVSVIYILLVIAMTHL